MIVTWVGGRKIRDWHLLKQTKITGGIIPPQHSSQQARSLNVGGRIHLLGSDEESCPRLFLSLLLVVQIWMGCVLPGEKARENKNKHKETNKQNKTNLLK